MKIILFVLLGVAYCNSKEPEKYSGSMFLFTPTDSKELALNGYKRGEMYFYKSVSDTVDNIDVINLDSGLFRKAYYIRNKTTRTREDGARLGIVKSVVDYILNEADSAILINTYSLVLKQNNFLFYVTFGYYSTGMATFYYRNMNIFNDKIYTIHELNKLLGSPHEPERVQAQNALNFIDPDWKSFLKYEVESGGAAVVDSVGINI